MNTHPAYDAVKNIHEKGAAIRIIMNMKKALEKKPTEKFIIKDSAPQFTDKAEKLIRSDFPKELEILFSFDPANEEVTATVTPTTKKPDNGETQ